MVNIYTYVTELPPRIKEMVTPCEDGYTVYIADRLDKAERAKAYNHALEHIKNDDFKPDSNVQDAEDKAHGRKPKTPPKSRKRSRWEAYHRKQMRKERGLRKMGLKRERYIGDDDYGCPVVKYRIVKE